jgi:opacity protein-like surface antigen
MLAPVSVGVAAQPQAPQELKGFYAGGGVGSTEPTSYDYEDWYYADVESGDSATSGMLFTGYRINKYVAVDAAYIDTDSVGWSESLVYVPELLGVYNTDIDLDIRAWQLSVSGILPFANIFEAYLRGGLAFWDADGTQQFTPSFGGAVVNRSVSDGGTGFLFGIGGSVRVLPRLHLLLEYQVFDVDEDLFATDYDSGTIDTFLLGVQYRFGASR